MSTLRYLLLCLWLPVSLPAQNLVVNPGFEDSTGIFCGVEPRGGRRLLVAGWSAPTGGTPDVYTYDLPAQCHNYPLTLYLSNYLGFEPPRSGRAMGGFTLSMPCPAVLGVIPADRTITTGSICKGDW